MKSTMTGASLMLIAVLAAGCTKNAAPANSSSTSFAPAPVDAQTPDASIKSAIQAHLAHKGNLNLQAFQTEVKHLNIQGDHAQADVEFHVKDGPGVMQLSYALEKRDNAWSVVESVPASSNFSHPALDSSQTPNANGPAAPVDPMSDPVRFFKSATPAQPVPR